MRIVLLGNAALAVALRRAGHAVLTAGSQVGGLDVEIRHPLAPGHLERILADRAFAPDVLVLMDDGRLPTVLGLESLPFPSIFYSIDTFCNPWHIPYASAFDSILVAQRDFVPLFADEGHKAAWFPLFDQAEFGSGVPREASPQDWLAARDIPVAFVGTLQPRNIPQRFPFLQAFRERQPLVMMQGDYTPVFHRTRIVLNQTAVSEVNFRCFESMGCGAALLTDSTGHGLTDLFHVGTHILPPYAKNNAAEAAAKAHYWLERPLELAAIALAGAALVAEKHTDDARAAELVRLCVGLAESKAHEVRLSDAPHRRRILAMAYGALAAELGSNLADLRELYQNVCLGLSGT